MKVFSGNETIPTDGLVATIGVFDGVHLGHRFLIDKVRQIASGSGFGSAVITFPRSPRAFFDKSRNFQLLTLPDEKEKLLKETGIDVCININFSEDIAEMTAKEFITDILHTRYGIKHLLIGYDHRFGKGRSEGYEEYVEYGASVGMKITQAPAYLYDNNVFISSSLIRSLLKAGNTYLASTYLGLPYRISGTVAKGFRIGSNLGYPTANIIVDSPEKLLPKEGVYAVYTYLSGIKHKGMLNIGYNPTFHEKSKRSIEVHLFNFSEDIYGCRIEVSFIKYLRTEKKFENKEEIIIQLGKDKEAALEIL